ncbi:MAG TPA: GAF domain-containing protein [Jatrophihabitans sp.]|jgi:GAF domain-containing protein|nr:GAF domain-containing protein [Jatrophihabitans sp.]
MTEDQSVDASADAVELLQSVVRVARAIFGAAASSVFLLDHATHELVFQAVAGAGEQSLIGTRFPADRGIAGWVAMSGDAMVVDDLSTDATFARDLAESTRYVPNALMAVPLIDRGNVLGVLEVLDPAAQSRTDLAELDLLQLFAAQAATALRMVLAHRSQPAAGFAALRTVQQLTPSDRAAGLQLIDAMRALLATTS